jgi:hypothetical protein
MFGLVCVIGFCLFLGSCIGDSSQNTNTATNNKKQVVALIFCDVTNSLTKEENKRVGTLAADIIDRLPQEARFKLYTIQIQTQLPTKIKLDINKNGEEDAEDISVPAMEDNIKQKEYETTTVKERRKQIESEIEELFKRFNKGDDKRTCILNALGFAAGYFDTEYKDDKDNKYDLRLYLISDMVEECKTTPLPGKVVNMAKRDISTEIGLADKLATGWNLAKVKIECIFPTALGTPDSPGTSDVSRQVRPDREDVKRFWNAIFKHLNFQDEDFKNQRIVWRDSGDLPERL